MQMSLYDFMGWMSAGTVVLSLGGIAAQLRLIWQRKALYTAGDLDGQTPTEILSLNRFSSSFIAFFAMFLYGMTMGTINGYVAFPRAIAVTLLLVILYEMQADRRDRRSRTVFYMCLGFVIASIAFCLTPYRSALSEAGISQAIVVATCFIFAQGATHQIMMIRKTGKTGALSVWMFSMFFLKDVFAVIFGFLMGLDHGWPVLLMHAVSLTAQSTTLYHFWWVKRSDKALKRREASIA